MPKKRRAVRLTAAERDIVEKFVAHGTKSARAINRARILLLLDEERSEKELTTILGVSRGTMCNVRKKYLEMEHAHILHQAVLAWTDTRNRDHKTVHRTFSQNDARDKFQRHCHNVQKFM
jgi:hypothetical protein